MKSCKITMPKMAAMVSQEKMGRCTPEDGILASRFDMLEGMQPQHFYQYMWNNTSFLFYTKKKPGGSQFALPWFMGSIRIETNQIMQAKL